MQEQSGLSRRAFVRNTMAAGAALSTLSIPAVHAIKNREVVVRKNLANVSSDPVLRRTARAVFAVNRLSFDNLQRLDPDSDFATVWQAGSGVGANPHDVLWGSDEKLYVTRYEPPFNDVAVVSPRTGGTASSIVLEELAEETKREAEEARNQLEANRISRVALRQQDERLELDAVYVDLARFPEIDEAPVVAAAVFFQEVVHQGLL